jgi:glycosyltransferase involved in cell wall biosynthesis
MAFSREIDEVGRIKIRKIWHLLAVIIRIYYMRLRHKAPILYYPPAGPEFIPMYRDLVILLLTRWLFKKTVFFFHAGGISELYRRLPGWLRFLFRRAYFGADLAIRPSELNPPDGERLKAINNIVLPHGLPDNYPQFQKSRSTEITTPTLLFVGALTETKGILVLLDTCRLLRDSGQKFKVRFVGHFESEAFRNSANLTIARNGLGDCVEFAGVLTGEKKWLAYSQADIFCFPSFYENETFGLVLLEAMQFELPVVATHWRGIPSVVEDGRSGFLVPIKDSRVFSEKVATLLGNAELRKGMGRRGREVYLERFTIQKFWQGLESAFLSIA